MKRVVILKVDDYNCDVLKQKIKEAISKYFPFKNFSPQDKILLKPNLLMEALPQEAVTTHPVFIEAVGSIFKEMGCSVFIADSPGGFIDNKNMDYIYGAIGIKEISDKHDFELLHPSQSKVHQGLPLCWWASPSGNNDFKVINLPKLKTHDIMILTLATKNLYGCISGLHKSHLHMVYPKTDDFADVIVKLYKMITPSLNIVDGILALEGDGPAKKGKPKKLGVVIIGDDALYTDYAIGKLLGLKDDFHPLIKKAKQEGLLREDDLEIISEIPKENILSLEFPSASIINNIPKFLIPILKLLLKFRPEINIKKCTVCAKCKEICPSNAIEIIDSKVVIDYRKCIKCMCCSEMCRFAAVDVRASFLINLIKKIHRCLP